MMMMMMMMMVILWGQFCEVASHMPAVGWVSVLGVFSYLPLWFCGLMIWE
jgi:hypothetical protein